MKTNVQKVWFEVWVEGGICQQPMGSRIDGRRRSKKTAERIAKELRATKNYGQVWLVEVNRLKRSPV